MLRSTAAVRSASKIVGRRTISTGVTGQTKYTTLSNGVTIATETNPFAKTSTVGAYIQGGSRSEHPYNNGVSALTAELLASSKAEAGVLVSAESTHETNAILAQSTNEDVLEAAKTISGIISNATANLESGDFSKARSTISSKIAAIEANETSKVLSHLNATAFQGYSLGLPINGTVDSINDIELQDSLRFTDKHLVGENTVIAASGNFDHDKLVDALEASLKVPSGFKPAVKPASFLGSEIRMRDDTLPKAWISIAAQGEGLNSPAYYVAKVASAVSGNFYDKSAIAKFQSSKLSSIVQEYHIVDKYTSYSTSYSDTGLFGFHAEISNIYQIDDLTHFFLKEWNRLSISVTDAEIARAKNQVKTELLASLNSSNAIASDIGNKVLLAGSRQSVKEALSKIDAISTKDVKAWAQVALWDQDVVVAGTGQIEDLFDYMTIRNGMAMMRW
ncbi:cytochrome b-c1 complex subunit 1, mitochondrial [[Candida] railenensis]|uniref:Cytochrome b-c1 complex subunit 1, mitochondrial n=1 Tax=[Candida] railenensis TaxID=45579 RepID=A0A9P0QNR0_9ASCO|nr:cytochrome b-c1 complex subunit 1, mitochondrial [[Candida] railenensis]